MIFHPPSFKGKRKFRNAEAAQKARQADEDWKALKQRMGVEADDRKQKRGLAAPAYVPPKLNYRGSGDPKIPSLSTNLGSCIKAEPKMYTGDRLIGIGIMHKSNLVPIFSEDEAKDISTMRR